MTVRWIQTLGEGPLFPNTNPPQAKSAFRAKSVSPSLFSSTSQYSQPGPAFVKLQPSSSSGGGRSPAPAQAASVNTANISDAGPPGLFSSGSAASSGSSPTPVEASAGAAADIPTTRPLPAPALFPRFSDQDWQLRLAIYSRQNPGKISPADYGAACKNDVGTDWPSNPQKLIPPPQKLAGNSTVGALSKLVPSRTDDAFNSFLKSAGLSDKYASLTAEEARDLAYATLADATQSIAGDAAKAQALVDEINGPCPATLFVRSTDVKPTCPEGSTLDPKTNLCVPNPPSSKSSDTNWGLIALVVGGGLLGILALAKKDKGSKKSP